MDTASSQVLCRYGCMRRNGRGMTVASGSKYRPGSVSKSAVAVQLLAGLRGGLLFPLWAVHITVSGQGVREVNRG